MKIKLKDVLQSMAKQLTRGSKAGASRGMNLLEIMVALVIIGLVTGVVGVSVMNTLTRAQEKTTKTQIKNLEESLEMYRLSKHRYPTTAEGLQALAAPGGNDTPFIKEVPNDAWDKPFVYISPGSHNQGGFDLMSYGPDGVEGGGDDIANWSSK